MDQALTAFKMALEKGPNADAEYGLGAIAEDQGLFGDALSHYQRALRFSPNHAAAQKRSDRLILKFNDIAHRDPNPDGGRNGMNERNAPADINTPQQKFDRPAAYRPVNSSTENVTAFYRTLSDDANNKNSATKMLSKKCVRFIDAISMERRPRRSVAPFSMVLAWLSPFAFVGMLLAAGKAQGGPVGVALFVVVAVFALFTIRYWRLRRTHYSFTGGWLIVRKGILFTDETSWELTHLIDVKITRGPVERITGNAELHLNFDKYGSVVLRGFSPAAEMKKLRDTLINGAAVLRTHPMVKGLVGT